MYNLKLSKIQRSRKIWPVRARRKRQWTDANQEMTDVLELSQDLKAAIITMLYKVKWILSKQRKVSLIWEEAIKQNQRVITELKITIFEIKTSLERLNSRIKTTDVLISYGCLNKVPQTRWFKINSVIDLMVSIGFNQGIWNQGVDRAVLPLKALGKNVHFSSSSFWWLSVFLVATSL